MNRAPRGTPAFLTPVQEFFRTESASGIALMAATAAALVFANSPLREAYAHLLHVPVRFELGFLRIDQTLLHFINDGLMAVFFLLIGLEIKREIRYGELADPRQAVLPIGAALGGAAVPALIYFLLNRSGDAAAGWAIPMATDIAFALGVLALLGPRIPGWLKIFLMTLAIVDDLIAVLVIAIFYTSSLSVGALGWAFVITGALILLNASGVHRLGPYLLLGFFLWLAVLDSGIHATIAGVVLGLIVPSTRSPRAEQEAQVAEESLQRFRSAISGVAAEPEREDYEAALNRLEEMIVRAESPMHRLEHKLHAGVAFGIMPLFAIANAGVPLSGEALGAASVSSISIGILLGLVVGKQIGIFLASVLLLRLGVSRLPESGSTLRALYGVSLLGGIGFTMSLFVAGLAFGTGPLLDEARVAILGASLICGVAGWLVLRGLPGAVRRRPLED